jgi:hypothetical protein
MERNKPANGGYIPVLRRRTCGSCQDRTDYPALQARSGARERGSPHRAADGTKSVQPWITESETGDESVSRSWRSLLPGVMSIRAWWHRRRARAHLTNELLAAMDPPSRLDREDRMSDPRPVTRCTGSADAQTPPHGQPHTNVRLSKTSTTPAAPPYQPVDAKEPHTKPVTHGTVSSG